MKILKQYAPSGIGDFLIIVLDHEYKDVSLEFRAYECTALNMDGTPCYERDCQYEEDWQQADVFLSGGIKWDGCCNVRFDGQDDCYLHFCGLEDTAKINRLFTRLYEIAAECVEKFDVELAK